MPLDPARLEKVRRLDGGGFTARCPACAQMDRDKHGQHLRQFSDGKFACAAFPGDGGHRRAIYALAGDKSARAALPAAAAVAFKRAARRRDELIAQFKADLPRILRAPLTPFRLRVESPAEIPAKPADQARAILRLFAPGDVVWVGDHHDSGHPRHASHFRTAEAWLSSSVCPHGPRICPCSFRPGVFRRLNDNLRVRRFLVLESDSLPASEQLSLLKWIAQQTRLRAVVDTKGRSFHGWFDVPTPAQLRDLRNVLESVPGLMDAALFNPTQPCRLPGWPRDDTQALPQLIYLDP